MKRLILLLVITCVFNICKSQSVFYSYDKSNRLVETRVGCAVTKYSYDNNGNRSQRLSSSIKVSSSITDVTCLSNGTISLVPPSGSSYDYSWSNGQTGAAISNLSAGNYSVVITDKQLNFSCVQSYTVSAPPSMGTFTVTTKNTSCYGLSDGKAKVNIITSPSNAHYEYLWNNLTIPNVYQSADSVTGIAAGSYTVSIKNATDGCVKQIPFTISSPKDIIDKVTTVDNNCLGDTKGSATVKTVLTSSNYLFSWTGNGLNAPQTTPAISLLSKGKYDLIVTEKSGNHCVANRSININDIRSKEIVDISITPPTCEQPLYGIVEASTLSSASNYLYEWFSKDDNISVGDNSATATLPPGNYSLTVTENTYRCKDSKEFRIQEFVMPNSDFLVYPNPTTGTVTITSCEFITGAIFYTLTDPSQRLLTSGQILRLPLIINLNQYPKGNYFVNLFYNQTDSRPFKILKIIKL